MARHIKYAGIVISGLLGLAAMSAAATESSQPPTVKPSIIGGENAKPNEFPSYIGVLVRQLGAPKDSLLCGGTLIAPQWVLTARHCNLHGRVIPDAPFEEPVWLDAIQGLTDMELGNGRRVKVAKAFNHPDPKLDIALLKLEQPLSYSPVLLPVSDWLEKRLAPAGTGLVVAGYGATSSDGQSYPRYLQKLNMTRWTDQQCSTAWPHDNDPETDPAANFDAKYMLCAGKRTEIENACYGDSGGPLYRKVPGYAPILVGVTSWGAEGCIAEDAPGVYARVSTAFPWVISTIAKNSTKGSKGLKGLKK